MREYSSLVKKLTIQTFEFSVTPGGQFTHQTNYLFLLPIVTAQKAVRVKKIAEKSFAQVSY